ncbi:MAG: hypothetical protein U0Q16_25320 [Bryobacteraceae bacterium]
MAWSKAVLAGLTLALAGGLWAGPLDGSWKGETKLHRKGGEKAVPVTLNLEANEGGLKGTMELGKRSLAIGDGRVEGVRFWFTTVMKGKNGERKVRWRGEVKGDTLEVSRGGKKKGGEPVVLKRG